MEALTAFSLAGTILEFARFGIDLLSDGRELYKSSHGALSANEQLELATADLCALLVKLRSRERPKTILEDNEDQKIFQHILCDAEKVAAELLERLEGLKVKGAKGRKWESVRKALHTASTKANIGTLTKTLEGYKNALKTNILFSVVGTLEEESLRNSERFNHLDERTQLIISSLLDASNGAKKTTKLTQEVRDQMQTVLQLVRRIDITQTEDHHRTRSQVANEQASAGEDQFGERRAIIARYEMLDVSNNQETELRRTVQKELLDNLTYSSMAERYEDIVEAFPDTFNWALEDSTEYQSLWNNFPEWLKAGSGIYWISGKAGSGKSTLMKHIFDDSRTHDYLDQWVKNGNGSNKVGRDVRFCLATFFFWTSGTREQKSQNGLLRALLHQVLSSFPELISIVFPDLWAKRYLALIRNTQDFDSHPQKFDEAWTLGRLTSAFRKLAQQTMVPLKLCFLVDGLDEFHGDHEDLASLFQVVTKSPSIKICLSSRPWVIFEQIYASRPSMRLQDLTYNDIKHFVSNKFDLSPAFGILQESDPDSAKLLRHEIIEKAEGVFLWVEIVVRSLLFGIRNQDDITILRQRLTSMPQKLEDLYHHLLGLIEPVYLVWASKAFQVVRAARELHVDEPPVKHRRDEGNTSLNLSTFSFAMNENVNFEAPNSFSIIEKVSSIPTHAITQQDILAKCATVRWHLTARCAGLLEVPSFDRDGPNASIRFHHRTARDFLHNDDRWNQILGYTNGTGFNPHKALLMSYLLELAIINTDGCMRSDKIQNRATNAMLYAYYTNTPQFVTERRLWSWISWIRS
ncbi:hypothetical protein N431DRAFT_559214 [Stipitochalara longipes BDJ]|nr:hypothetical protein N431DRAFT_559214 [Stipitochalara longipes BDJ]